MTTSSVSPSAMIHNEEEDEECSNSCSSCSSSMKEEFEFISKDEMKI